MGKNRNRKQVHIPGQNGATHIKVPVSRIDPNVAPRGSAFTPEDANKLGNAALQGVQQIFHAMGLKGFFVACVVPIVEYRKDIPLPGGGMKDDFIITSGRHPCYSSVGQDPVLIEAAKAIAAGLWKGAYGVEQGAPPEAPSPEVPPSTETPAEPA